MGGRVQLDEYRNMDPEAAARTGMAPLPLLTLKAAIEEMVEGEVADLIDIVFEGRAEEAVKTLVGEHVKLYYSVQYYLGSLVAIERGAYALGSTINDLMEKATMKAFAQSIPMAVVVRTERKEGSDHMYT